MSHPMRLFLTVLACGTAIILNAQAPAKAPAKAAPKAAPAAQPPKPGLASCAGKIEGRYAASNGMPYTMEFRSGKATLTAPIMGSQETTCWTGGGKIYLYLAGDPEPMVMDINDDGTIQNPMMGEMKKKGS